MELSQGSDDNTIILPCIKNTKNGMFFNTTDLVLLFPDVNINNVLIFVGGYDF